MKNEIAEKMKKCWADPFSTEYDPRHLLKIGAEEIEGLQNNICEKLYNTLKNKYISGSPSDYKEGYNLGITLALQEIEKVRKNG